MVSLYSVLFSKYGRQCWELTIITIINWSSKCYQRTFHYFRFAISECRVNCPLQQRLKGTKCGLSNCGRTITTRSILVEHDVSKGFPNIKINYFLTIGHCKGIVLFYLIPLYDVDVFWYVSKVTSPLQSSVLWKSDRLSTKIFNLNSPRIQIKLSNGFYRNFGLVQSRIDLHRYFGISITQSENFRVSFSLYFIASNCLYCLQLFLQ